MRMWSKSTSRAALVAAGAMVAGSAFGPGAVATADMKTSGDFSVLGGNQVRIPISVPVDVSGNAVAVLGAAEAKSKGGAKVGNARHGGGGGMKTSGNFSVGGGNQVNAPISIPVDVCGNAIAIIGLAKAKCKGGASVNSGGKSHHGYRESGYRETGERTSGERRAVGATERGWNGGGWGGMKTSGNFSILGGNQVYAPISVPVNVCGNAVAVLGLAKAKCKGGASVKSGHRKSHGDPKMKTSGNFSILGGNQVYAPISVPVNVCGNAVAVLGLAQAQCKGGATVGDSPKKPPHKPHKKPHKKPYKPSKHRPAAKHKKLPSTLRTENSRMASAPAASAAPARPAAASAAPIGKRVDGTVKRIVKKVKSVVKLPGVDVKPGRVGPQLPASDGSAPVKLGGPALT